tara:strand:- start:108 stop:269 length:162 start_codon:yes stop_codon:yes gene_type:complete
MASATNKKNTIIPNTTDQEYKNPIRKRALMPPMRIVAVRVFIAPPLVEFTDVE